ncbi:metal ABC transporter solute-binding protein [Lactiplantibacillus mudanjiangensis]|uniref:Metal ABC transporter substrate-binding protein [Lactobacillus pentosus] n=1 Tax=Lactiplantibacillus mudanjiangensis TaxID=1296538 RepID=A0A660E2P5_9LACO|nr:metal ABC transporter solute-binding protein [Lactiplantibacillus mudanjiangensis]VDG23952.1 metal ABC transporter substrate-binding protein [Lactobacillus pentosus] [Lactiplantibacillus mudanjiangensis]VDG27133.1 metal ABC transporter substrate-binding protein [Lactobacillus pentosus] [Lactiplantibacillus mudanjiangensis]VDG33964.1 metal ABC transporter substrate-binding protein [Lactobacillus pentosus] [Lactiplantibacillus mudanjiangensis]
MQRKHAILMLLVGILGSLGLLAGCQKTSTTNTNKIKVVATTNFYGEVARAVGGKHVQVTSVINKPSVDPHDYEPTATIATTVAKADVVLANGLGYDGWMSKLVKNAPDATYLRVGETIMHKKSGVNEHLWYNAKTMPAVANALAKQYAKAQPKYKAQFKANAKKYIASLKPVDQARAKVKKAANKLATKNVLVSEPVFDYALQDLGFKVTNKNFENAVEKGTDPSPKVIQQMQQQLKTGKVAFFVQNKQVSDKMVTNMVKLAKQNKVPVLQVTETKPANQTYQQWMVSQYSALAKLLK